MTLGEFTKDTIPDQSIADAAFAVQKDGGVSPVVAGSFGPVILRITGIKPETTRTLEEAKEDIRKDLATAAAAEEVTNVHDRYEDLRAGGSSLADAAKQLNLKPVTIDAIDAAGLDERATPFRTCPRRSLPGKSSRPNPAPKPCRSILAAKATSGSTSIRSSPPATARLPKCATMSWPTGRQSSSAQRLLPRPTS